MDRHEALHIIKESGLVAEKMTEEEKAAKRKARREARKAEANAYKDTHWFFDLNVRGGGSYSMLYTLVKYMSNRLEGADFRYDTEDEEWVGLRWYKNDNAGNKHSAAIYFDTKYPKDREIYAELYVDGDDTKNKYEYRDSEGTNSWMSMRLSNLNYHFKEYARGRTSEFDFEVIINKKDWIEYVENIAKIAKDTLDRAVALADEGTKDPAEREIPDFEHLEFEFTDDPIDDMTGKDMSYRVPKDSVMSFFHKNCGEDNNSYKDFKDLFDSMDISYMRSLDQPESLFRGSFSFSQYKWFKRGGGELNGRLWSFPAFLGYENDDVQVKGWKLT